MVMAYLRKDGFPRGMHSKLNYKKIGACQVLRKIFDNAYKLELLEDFVISLIFNVVDLYEFHEGGENGEEGTLIKWKKQLSIKPVEKMRKSWLRGLAKGPAINNITNI
jgi:hypothetical protein